MPSGMKSVSATSALKAEPSSAPAPQDALVRARIRAERNHRLRVNVLRVVLIVGFFGLWEWLAQAKIIDPFFFGQPSGILAQLQRWVTRGTAQGPLIDQIVITLEETILGFIIGVLAGVITGVALGSNRTLSEVLGPFIKVANSFPRIVLGSIFVIWLGLGMASKVLLAVVLVFFVVFFNAYQGVREVDRNLIANAKLLGASPRQVSAEVVIPAALSWIIASLHTSFGFALIGAVVGEFLGSSEGIGLMISTAQGTFNPNGVFAGMFILAVVALTAEALVTWLEGVLLKWRPPSVSDVRL